jgi:hypothetical protein
MSVTINIRQIVTSVGEDTKKLEPSHFASGKGNSVSILNNEVFLKRVKRVAIWLSNFILEQKNFKKMYIYPILVHVCAKQHSP